MFTRERFISIEGLSGVGKSTTSKLLAQQLNAEVVGTIPPNFQELRRFLDNLYSIHARFCFFLAAVFYSAEEIKKIVEDGKNVVTESYLYRTIAFHRGMGSNLLFELPKDILLPNYAFHLTCDEQERQRRRMERKKSETYWDRLAENNSAIILQEYTRFQMFEIDTSILRPEEVIAQIVNHIMLEESRV